MLGFVTSRFVDSITATNWEGTGVVPDVVSPPGTVIETAVAALR